MLAEPDVLVRRGEFLHKTEGFLGSLAVLVRLHIVQVALEVIPGTGNPWKVALELLPRSKLVVLD